MRTDVFTCDEPGCKERLERFQGMGVPDGWHQVDVPHYPGGCVKPVYLCPAHTTALIERFRHVPLPFGGRRVEPKP